MGSAGGVGADQDLWCVRVLRPRTVVRWQRIERLAQHGDVIGGGVTAGVARPQQPGQGLPAGDVGAIQKHQQRVKAEGVLPGRGRVLLIVGMVDGDGGIDIDVQPAIAGRGSPRGPGPRPRVRSRRPDPRQPGGIDALIDQPPQRGRRGDRPERVPAIPPQLTDPVHTVGTIGHRSRQIGEHIPGRMRPRPVVRLRQRGGDLQGQPGQVGHLAQHAHPGVRHDAMAVRRHFHPRNRCATVHLESAFPLGIMDSRQASSFLAGQALSLTQAPCHTTLHEKSRLGLCVFTERFLQRYAAEHVRRHSAPPKSAAERDEQTLDPPPDPARSDAGLQDLARRVASGVEPSGGDSPPIG